MKHIFFLFFFLMVGFCVHAQEDEGVDLSWEEFVDSTDFSIVYDTLDNSEPFDSIVAIDTNYVTKYRSRDTISLLDGAGGLVFTIIERVQTLEQQAQALSDRLKTEGNEEAFHMRLAMEAAANARNAKQAKEDLTGESNAYLAIYDEIWPKIPSLRIRSTLTDSTDAFFVGDFNMTPNSTNGVVRDSSNTIIARIFPKSENNWRVVIADDGSIPNGVSVSLYSKDRQRFVMREADPTAGRVFINLSIPLP